MSIPKSMKQITEVAKKLIAPADVQSSFILPEEQLKKQERCIIFQSDAPDKTELVLGDEFEVKVEDGKIFVVRKQPSYPKTYEECCKILGLEDSIIEGCLGYEYKLLNAFQKLLLCRDAYWKITGEKNKGNIDYVICNIGGKIINTNIPNSAYNHILAFPTEEMRDAFYENFKDLIEECKELL